jgi:hypothetical protein
MFRNRVRPPTPPLDEVTAERLLDGAPIEELPSAYRPLGQLVARATGPATDGELAGSATAAAEFVAAHDAATAPRRRVRSMATSVFVTLTLAASTGTAVAAVQGALPQPIQQVAHEALGVVGIGVPGINRENHDPASGNRSDDPAPSVGVSATPSSTTTPTGARGGVVAATTSNGADGSTSTNTATAPPSSDDSGTPPIDHEANPNAGAGNNSGEGNPNPGDGNQGVGGGDQGAPGGQPAGPPSNLPSQSNGKGNGPPQVPPGQAKQNP